MPQDDLSQTSDSPDPDPAVTAGLEDGGALQPGDTSPFSDSMSGTTNEHRDERSNAGPVSGNRTPMIITLSILGVIVLLTAGFIAAALFAS